MDEYIKREDVLTAFEGADADVMADYGAWAEWGFSLTKIKEVIQAVPMTGREDNYVPNPHKEGADND